MIRVDTSGKIVTSIMTLELLESPELDYMHFWCICRAGSRISGKAAYMKCHRNVPDTYISSISFLLQVSSLPISIIYLSVLTTHPIP